MSKSWAFLGLQACSGCRQGVPRKGLVVGFAACSGCRWGSGDLGCLGNAGLFWWQIGRTDTVLGARNANGLIFFAMLFLAFATMFVALFTFPNEYKVSSQVHKKLYKCVLLFTSRSLEGLAPFGVAWL